jgi:hypothetical protein
VFSKKSFNSNHLGYRMVTIVVVVVELGHIELELGLVVGLVELGV